LALLVHLSLSLARASPKALSMGVIPNLLTPHPIIALPALGGFISLNDASPPRLDRLPRIKKLSVPPIDYEL